MCPSSDAPERRGMSASLETDENLAKTAIVAKRIDRIAEAVDQLVTLDVAGRGFIDVVYPAPREAQGGPLCMLAAQQLRDRVGMDDVALICSGQLVYPLSLPENDGPMGSAVLARALAL